MRLEAQAKAGFYPTPSEVVEIIKTWIGEKKPGPKRLLDPCCGTGETPARVAAAAECDAYGVEINADRAQAAKTLLNKVIAGNLFSVRASHEAFSLLYLNPPYDFDAEDGRTELSFLKHTLPYLAPRGLLLFIVPQKRVTFRIARVLSAHIEDPRIRKFPVEQFQTFGQIVIAGIKKARPEIDGAVLSTLNQIQGAELPEMVPGEFPFTIPAVPKDFFIRSSEMSPDELAQELKTSPLWKEPVLGLLAESDPTRPAIQPLMPPRKAHLAM